MVKENHGISVYSELYRCVYFLWLDGGIGVDTTDLRSVALWHPSSSLGPATILK